MILIFYPCYNFDVFIKKGRADGSKVFKFVDEMDFFFIGKEDIFGEDVVVEVVSCLLER